ncbi:hypothetical protein PITCH_A1040011 [uncultured Desulfobacterium sp.]|uniref:Uncharacterized protein n=1 Tax=uncultured Desulfobacterium sp. TaxID=201089 RepID=A0A445MQP8_9BACT|nr:hypothetical protein PITCH_A1040011 [uncultured Desulfobacterium sp.]
MKADEDTEYFDVEDLKRYRTLPVEKKLIYIEEASRFFKEAMPAESKKAWEKLKKNGW